VTTAREVCVTLNSFGTTAEIKATSNAAVTDLNLQVKAANSARNGVKADKKKVDQLWWRANTARNEELAFIDHVENLVIPSEAGKAC